MTSLWGAPRPPRPPAKPLPIRVLLVDDHSVLRQALRMLLQSREEIEVVADAENGREAVAAVEEHAPAVVLMDVVMPGLNGLEATRQIRRASPDTRVIMLSGFVDEDQLIDAVRAGASGYLVKSSDVEELVGAIKAVDAGDEFFSHALSAGMNVSALVERAKRDDPGEASEPLTSREREVLQLIAEGRTNSSIAEELSIAVKTVEAHRAHMMAKLRARNRTDLILYALRKNIVSLESVEDAQRTISLLRGSAED